MNALMSLAIAGMLGMVTGNAATPNPSPGCPLDSIDWNQFPNISPLVPVGDDCSRADFQEASLALFYSSFGDDAQFIQLSAQGDADSKSGEAHVLASDGAGSYLGVMIAGTQSHSPCGVHILVQVLAGGPAVGVKLTSNVDCLDGIMIGDAAIEQFGVLSCGDKVALEGVDPDWTAVSSNYWTPTDYGAPWGDFQEGLCVQLP